MNKEKENKNAEISARIAEILQYTGDTRNGFAVKLGYERAQTVYDVMNMKSAPSYDFFRRFSISEYSDIIDLRWLLSGEGSMLRDSKTSEESKLGVTPNATPISSAEESIIYKMYKDEKEEKERLVKEKETKIDYLQSELRSMAEELAALKAKYPESTTDKPVGLGSSETAPHAPSHPHSPTSEHYHGGSLPPQENQ